ncbi:MAG: flagellin/flagellar hook associated protein [Xanthomonadaceae bacterium]|nr:flagellin/flagellar hook associated protein [Xanthomonadaceae bacterium]
MSLTINTNINSLVAQNNLNKSQSALAQATERLSSGLKINSATDNAAGFAISTRFTTQIGGLGQASANASDAINLAQTTQSALDQVTANLQAIRDLAVQSANGNYSNSDRASINTEVQQRLSEITRIANQTDFNGQKVLDGSLGTLSFQVGANVGQTISVDVSQGVRTNQVGAVAEVSTGNISAAFNPTSGSITGSAAADVTGTPYTFTVDGHSVTTLAADTTSAALVSDVQSQLNTAAPNTYTVSANASGVLTIKNNATGTASAAPVIAGAGAANAFGAAPVSTAGAASGLTAAGVSINGTTVDLSSATTLQNVSDAINAASISGVSAAVNAAGNGINLYSSDATNGLKITDANGTFITAAATNGNTAAAYTAGSTAAVGGSLQGSSVTTVDNANALISRIDVALSTVSDLNSTLGAIQNRFESTISTLSAEQNSLSASQSNIRDANFAAETANLSKANILQQAGISVLAQANAQPQQVLKLLQ